MAQTAYTAFYTKLQSGAWGVRVIGAKPAAGTVLRVTKKSGETKTETIARVLWTGTDKHTGSQVSLCAIEAAQRASGYSRSYGRNAPHGRTCSYCGARDCPRAWNPKALCQED